MYKITYLAKFKQKHKRLKLPSAVQEKLEDAVSILATEGALNGKYRDHKLQKSKATKRSSNSDNNYEFHLMGDIIVRYIIDRQKKEIIFCDIGTHRQVLLQGSYDFGSAKHTKLFV